jgi:hypothetical protein
MPPRVGTPGGGMPPGMAMGMGMGSPPRGAPMPPRGGPGGMPSPHYIPAAPVPEIMFPLIAT